MSRPKFVCTAFPTFLNLGFLGTSLGKHPKTRACRHLADSQAWLELLHDAADSG
jgi:hypothetical protein